MRNVCVLTNIDLIFQPKAIEVQVITHHMQRYAVWFGGSMLASTVSYQTPPLKIIKLCMGVVTMSSMSPALPVDSYNPSSGICVFKQWYGCQCHGFLMCT